MNEPIDRREYRSRCKHFLPCSEGCAKQSGFFHEANIEGHISLGCDGKCQRIRRYARNTVLTRRRLSYERRTEE